MKIVVGLILAIVFPGLILVLQYFDWLNAGEWPSAPLSLLVPAMEDAIWRAEWVDVARIVDALLELPLSLTSFGLGVIILIFPTRKSFN